MSVDIRGTKPMLGQIRRQYGEEKMLKAKDKALRKGTRYFVSVLHEQFQVFRDTGASIKEISQTEPYNIYGDVRMIKVFWEGPMSRYAIVHLNEYGSVKHPAPRGLGAIARTMYITEKPYKEIIKGVLEAEL